MILICTTDTHNALPYSESSYLSTNADISMSLEQQLNYCHMTLLGAQVECCTAFLYMYMYIGGIRSEGCSKGE